MQLAKVTGPAHAIMRGERIGLNLLARLSGIATQAYEILNAARAAGFNGTIAGSRKTTPGFRIFEKYALIVAQCDTHRYDLSSCVMLKDNHIDLVGSIDEAIKRARSLMSFTQKLHVECRSLADALEALKAGADIVMLDNMGPVESQSTAKEIKETFPKATVEISGGINITNIHLFSQSADTIDVISLGSLTQGYSSIDFSLKIL